MSDQKTSKDLPSAISSQGLEDGQSLSGKLDGQTIDLFGQEAALVSRLAAPDKTKAKKTKGTCGRHGMPSSKSINLQQSLENRLKMQFPSDGWMMSLVTWKSRITPSLRQYCQLVPLVRHTGETGFSLWPTANARDFQSGFSNAPNRQQSSLPRNVAESLGIQSGQRGTASLNWLLWYMGYPKTWLSPMLSAMQSYQKSRRGSSGQQCKELLK